jgi:hypothetical protein
VSKGGTVSGPKGKTGQQRWHCQDDRGTGCTWHGTQAIGITDLNAGIDKREVAILHRRIKGDDRHVRRYVITAAQNATPVHTQFFAGLISYCKHNSAQLLVIPYRYKNPTSFWGEEAKSEDWWAKETVPYLYPVRHQLNKNLIVLGDIKTQPTASSPLSGFETIAGGQSAIIGHPKLELTTVATPQQQLPKILTTTGACTQKNYIPSKAGKQGEFHHTFGACVVEVEGDLFHMRQINALSDGSFMDMEWEYVGAKRMRILRAAALVMGDTHVKFVDPQVQEATFGKKGIIARLKPKVLVWHDVFDCYAGSHHDRDKAIINYVKHHTGNGNVERELREAIAFMDDNTPADTTNVVVPSNHPNEHLWRWVNETDPRRDPENAIFWAQSYVAMCQLSKMGDGGVASIDIFTYWGKQLLKHKDTVFLHTDESYLLHGVELGIHGHIGANGARGSRKAFGKIGVKTIIGHAHSPGVKDGVYQVGTSSRLRLSYTRGPSSWLHTHCILYPNGKRTLINIIEGKYTA